jgi:hypothetical protein
MRKNRGAAAGGQRATIDTATTIAAAIPLAA